MPLQDGKQTRRETKNKRLILGAACAAVMLAGLPALSYAQWQNDGGLSVSVLTGGLLTKVALDAPLAQGRVADIRFWDRAAMENFYAARNNEPYWIKGRNVTNDARALLALIEDSWTHGLNPGKYHVREMRALMDGESLHDASRMELILTDAAMRYAHDMTGIRIDAGDLRLKDKFWRQPLVGAEIAARMSESGDIVAMLDSLAPRGELYDKLRQELIRQSREADERAHLLPLKFGGAYIFDPGDRHADVIKLRQLLGVRYDPSYGPENFFDDNTAAALMTFQRNHGLEPDGRIGPATMAVLNKSNEDTMKQIVANMERLRWLDIERPDKYIMVNIPSQRLWAIENGRVVEEMDVIVGAAGRQTKQFKTEITGLRLNPTWTVPLSLKMADFKPKLIEDPGYLHEKGIRLIEGFGYEARSVDPYAVDWANIEWREMNKLRFVQKPGDHNALGRFRVLMPSDYDIYLHDTNDPDKFARTQRTLSSGCIRMSDPEAIAHFIMKDNEDWSTAKMNALLEDGDMVDLPAARPFPVYIVYQSIWLDDHGDLVFGPDVYKQDRMLVEALARQDGFYLPQPEEDMAALGNGHENGLEGETINPRQAGTALASAD